MQWDGAGINGHDLPDPEPDADEVELELGEGVA